MIYGLSDLHLDITKKKDMGVFGNNWYNYEERIFKNWSECVKEDDLVLVRGDISWAMNEKEAYGDLIRLDRLPGMKILLKGNHDYWWSSLNKLKKLNLSTIKFLQNNAFFYEGYNICGARAWLSDDHPNFTEHDKKIFNRELIRLDLSLKEARRRGGKIIAMLHYPPFDKDRKGNVFHDLMVENDVKICCYGHLHGESLKNIREGNVDGIEYHCISGDYLDFKPKLLLEGI